MKREIKFRAIPINTNQFEYGYLFYHGDNPGIFQPGKGSLVCIKGSEGQYTGLNDIHNKEIYEGDIIVAENYKMYPTKAKVVKWDNDYLSYIFKSHMVAPNKLINCEKIEVIGNIHISLPAGVIKLEGE